MQLSKHNIEELRKGGAVSMPPASVFSLPEKVLQFGTGVLLRGLPDYFIDKANREDIFNGRIVVVKSTTTGDADVFHAQDGLYTLCVRGIEEDARTEENIVVSAVSRVLSASDQWKDILACAHNPEIQVVISNTTEVGIVPSKDNVRSGIPPSYPGKLLAFLLERYNAFNGSSQSGMIIIPMELIENNGSTLRQIVSDLAHHNGLGTAFQNWLEQDNHFCNSLVDRIVPGKLPEHEQREIEKELGYTDGLMIMAESFRLWAIESKHPLVSERLSFAKADNGMIITGNIEKFRELKLRLLNGTHTFSCGLAFLAGFETVKDAMADETMAAWIRRLMVLEVAMLIQDENISYNEACAFANSVLDRFRNPYLKHRWISISLNFTSKMRLRNIPLLSRLQDRKSVMPEHMALGFAAYLLFMRCTLSADGQYRGIWNNREYVVQDEYAAWFADKWKDKNARVLVEEVLSEKALWGEDLSVLKDFANLVVIYLQYLQQDDALEVINSRHLKKTIV